MERLNRGFDRFGGFRAFCIFVFFLTCFSGLGQFATLAAAPVEARIIHTPMTSLREGEKLIVEARVDGAVARVVYMRLYFKVQTEASFRYIEMNEGGAGFFAELPTSRLPGNKIEYFLLALIGNSDVVTYPSINPYGNPIEVSIAGRSPNQPPPAAPPTPSTKPRTNRPTTTQPATQPRTRSMVPARQQPSTTATSSDDEGPILILSPENGEEFGADEEVLVAVSFVAPDSDAVDISTMNLVIDGRNFTLNSETTENLMTFSLRNPKPGEHLIQVQGYYKSGKELPRVLWSFKVTGKSAQQFSEGPPVFQGRVFAETRHEEISDSDFHDTNIGGSMYGEYGIAKYSTNLYLTTREDSDFQPRHRFSFNIELPKVGLTLGDTYPRFNDLMLWGKRVRGVHGRVHLGFVNVDIVTGQTVRKVAADSAKVLDATGQPVPTTAGPDSLTLVPGTHAQNLFGLRTSFGSGSHFQLGFNMLKVRDDSTSLKPGEFTTFPQDNFVVGSDLMIGFAKRRIEFRTAVAFSWLTNDISGGPLSQQEIEDQFDVDLPGFLDPESIDNLLILNSSTTPLDPRDLTSLAFDTGFRFNMFNNNLQLGYKSIGSEYTSLGNSFMRTNLRGFYFQDRVRIYGNRLYLNLGFENYQDNFDADDQNPPTTLRTFNTGFSIYPGKGIPNLTFNIRNHNRDNDIDTLFVDPVLADTLDNRENSDTRDLSVQLSHDTYFMNLNHTISLSFINSNHSDKYVNTSENSSNVQVVSVRSVFPIPLVTTLNFARNANEFGHGINDFNFNMFGARAEYGFLNNRLNTYFGTNWTSASGTSATDTTGTTVTSKTDYNRFAFNTGARFELTPGQFFMLDLGLIRFNDNGFTVPDPTAPTVTVQNPSFTDKLLRLYYERRL